MGEPTDVSLRDTIRAHLADGRLPVVTGSARKASGDHRCACSDRTIATTGFECDPRDEPAVQRRDARGRNA